MVEVIIREDGTNSSISKATGQNGGARGREREQGKPQETQVNLNALLIDYTKQIITTGINLGIDRSGDYLLKDNLTNLTNIGADILMVAKGGYVGATAVAMKYGSNAINSLVELNRNKYKVEMLREQAGKVIELGGRYTND